MKLSKRALLLKPSPTLALAQLSKQMKAQGKNVISLSVGEPDWNTFEGIREEAIFHLRKEKSEATRYTPASGFLDLREAICDQAMEDLGIQYSPEQVLVSSGTKFVLFSALQCLVNPGDEVIVPSPYWVSYPVMVELAFGKVIFAPTRKEEGFLLKASEFEKWISENTKGIILNSPNNPTGVEYSEKDLEALASVLQKNPHITVFSDDIYNRLSFNSNAFSPHILNVAPDLKDRVLVINGVSKSYAMTGWRLGWGIGSLPLIQAMSHFQSQSISCASGLSQKAALKALRSSKKDIEKVLVELKERKEIIVALLKDIPHLEFQNPKGSFFLWLDISYYLKRRWKDQLVKNSSDFSKIFLREKLVSAVPGKEFGCEGFLRLSFALKREDITEAIRRLKEFLSEIS